MELVAETVDTLLGAGFLFVASRAAECRVEAIMIESLFQRFRFHHPCMDFGAMRDGIDVLRDAVRIRPDKQLEANLFRHAIAELDHFVELPTRIDVHQRERNLAWIERLLSQTEHHARILSDGIQHDGILKFRGDFTDDVNAFSFKLLQMCERVVFHGYDYSQSWA